MTWRTCLAAISFLVSVDGALAFCSKPDAPYCARQYDKFDDQSDFDSCKSEMESYQSEIDDFVSCVKREIEELDRQSNEAVDECNDAVATFNRRAGG